MKKNFLHQTMLTLSAMLALLSPLKAQECFQGEVWSCHYSTYTNSTVLYEVCSCQDPDSPQAQTCPEGQVLACRYHKCEIECKCLDIDDAAKWINRANGCNNGGGGGGWGGGGWGGGGNPHWNWWLSEGPNDDDDAASFSGIYPNPVFTSATLSFSLAEPQKVSIELFDLNGQLVSRLVDQSFEAGHHTMSWNVADIAAGMYILQFRSNQLLQSQTVIISN